MAKKEEEAGCDITIGNPTAGTSFRSLGEVVKGLLEKGGPGAEGLRDALNEKRRAES